MNFNQCHFCKKQTNTPFQITEIDKNGVVESFHSCQNCCEIFMSGLQKKIIQEETNLSEILSVEDLFLFIQDVESATIEDTSVKNDSCICGWTLKDFKFYGRFGCPNCYDHFPQIMKDIVFPYHGAKSHTGKVPVRYAKEKAEQPDEKMKLLKLRYAKLLELEEYEKIPDLLKEIDELTHHMKATTSEDQ